MRVNIISKLEKEAITAEAGGRLKDREEDGKQPRVYGLKVLRI